jgi:hypothetical protein
MAAAAAAAADDAAQLVAHGMDEPVSPDTACLYYVHIIRVKRVNCWH